MKILFILVPLAIVTLILFGLRRSAIRVRQERLIDSFRFPATVSNRLLEKYPHLTQPQATEVIDGLREYFQICRIAGKKMVSMPSQAVDVAWHEFILFTRNYELFCDKALGRFLHHTPAEAMESPTLAQTGIKTAWKLSCARENIPARNPDRLPLLFAMDDRLKIPDGFRYSLDCKAAGTSDYYCAGHIGCGSSCGSGTDGGGDSGCGGGCGGGD